MSIPSQGAEGAETMTAGIGPRIRKAVFEIASRRIKSGAPGLAPATAEAIARIIGLEAASALASPRADSDERTAGENITVEGAPGNRLAPWLLFGSDEEVIEALMRRSAGDVACLFFPTPVNVADPIRRTYYEGRPPRQQRLLAELLCRLKPATPAQPAGAVPDSLRALSEAASEDWDTNEATPYILGPPIDGEIDRFDVIARAPHGYAKNGDDIRKWQANRMFAVAAVKHVRTLLASHPGGQSAGSGADLFEASRRLIVEWGDAPELPEEMENALTRFEKVWLALDDGKPAPDSPLTGPVGACLSWRDMKDAPKGTPIIAKHKPNSSMPHGWVAVILLGHRDEEEAGSLDTILHYNGNALYSGFHGCWDGWLPVEALAARPAAPEAQGAWSFDMEAAPRDGTVILLWREGWGEPSAAYWGLAPMADGAGIATKRHPWVFLDSTNGVNGYEDGGHGPMAWHPMLDAPAPPASSGQEG